MQLRIPNSALLLWRLARGVRMRYAGAFLALLAGVGASFVTPLLTRWAIDGLTLERGDGDVPWGLIGSASAGVVAFAGVAAVFIYLRGRWAAVAAEEIVRRLRDELFRHIDRLPCSYHDGADTGDLVQRCTSDVETLRVFLASQLIEMGRAAFSFVVMVPLLFWLDAPLALFSLVLYPVILLFMVTYFRRVRRLFELSDEAEGRLTTVLQENLTGIRVVRAFARQEHECERFEDKNGGFRDSQRRHIDALGEYWALSDVLCFAQLGLVVFAGAGAVLSGRITLGDLQAFLMLESLVIWPVRQLGRTLNELGKAAVAMGRIRAVLESEVEPELDLPAPRLSGQVSFEKVTFRYEGASQDALCDLSFEIAPGETLALVGPPGSGKSTLASLILRLYEPTRGRILFDGRDSAELDRRALRAQIGAVLQEPFLFSRTLYENIALSPRAHNEGEVHAAARAAQIHASIESFPEGYATVVGERGVTLSGGQRQRTALARALVDRPPILILDDSLSAVDTRTESAILAALEEERGRSTTIVITHRLSAAARADRVLVLEAGRCIELGSHAELVRAGGPYARLWSVQTGLETDLPQSEGVSSDSAEERAKVKP